MPQHVSADRGASGHATQPYMAMWRQCLPITGACNRAGRNADWVSHTSKAGWCSMSIAWARMWRTPWAMWLCARSTEPAGPCGGVGVEQRWPGIVYSPRDQLDHPDRLTQLPRSLIFFLETLQTHISTGLALVWAPRVLFFYGFLCRSVGDFLGDQVS
jgi:hypothetical protein